MPRILRLMDEDDLPQVDTMFVKALAHLASVCKLDFHYDAERLFLTVETDIPASEVSNAYRKIVIPLLNRLDDEFGEFEFEMRALCECGCVATPRFSSGDSESDMCLCGKCLNKKIDEYRDGPRNTCPVCKNGFDGIKNPGWTVHCSARFGSQEDDAKPEMDIGTIRIGRDNVSKWSCCSRRCALEQFRKWLSKVESHRVAKEARS